MRAIEDYAQALLTSHDVSTVLDRLTDHITSVLDADGAGVFLADDDGRLPFVAATDGHTAALEEMQIITGDGPCRGVPVYPTGGRGRSRARAALTPPTVTR